MSSAGELQFQFTIRFLPFKRGLRPPGMIIVRVVSIRKCARSQTVLTRERQENPGNAFFGHDSPGCYLNPLLLRNKVIGWIVQNPMAFTGDSGWCHELRHIP